MKDGNYYTKWSNAGQTSSCLWANEKHKDAASQYAIDTFQYYKYFTLQSVFFKDIISRSCIFFIWTLNQSAAVIVIAFQLFYYYNIYSIEIMLFYKGVIMFLTAFLVRF